MIIGNKLRIDRPELASEELAKALAVRNYAIVRTKTENDRRIVVRNQVQPNSLSLWLDFDLAEQQQIDGHDLTRLLIDCPLGKITQAIDIECLLKVNAYNTDYSLGRCYVAEGRLWIQTLIAFRNELDLDLLTTYLDWLQGGLRQTVSRSDIPSLL